MSPSRLLQ